MDQDTVMVKIGDDVIIAKAKEFKTGSKGFFANGKVTINGKSHQVSANIVEIGSGKAKG
jgi:hypothetical protein